MNILGLISQLIGIKTLRLTYIYMATQCDKKGRRGQVIWCLVGA